MQRGVWAESAFGESSSLPSWLSDDSQTDASATVNQSRGCIELASSAQSATAELVTDVFSVNEFDGIYFGAVISHNTAAATLGDANTNIGFVTDSVDDGAYHLINNTAPESNAGSLRIRANGNDAQYADTRDAILQPPTITEILWDTENGEILHRYQDAGGVRVNSGTLPDPSLDYQIRARCQDVTTAGDKQLNIYHLKIAPVSFLG